MRLALKAVSGLTWGSVELTRGVEGDSKGSGMSFLSKDCGQGKQTHQRKRRGQSSAKALPVERAFSSGVVYYSIMQDDHHRSP
jgi:hypothetical protein